MKIVNLPKKKIYPLKVDGVVYELVKPTTLGEIAKFKKLQDELSGGAIEPIIQWLESIGLPREVSGCFDTELLTDITADLFKPEDDGKKN